MIRLVVDPGVLVSALIGRSGSPPDVVLQAWIDDRLELIVSPLLIQELRLVVLRPKFRKWFDEATGRQLVARMERHATVLPDPVRTSPLTRDPDDDYLVALARSAEATAIVSGDRDLLVLEGNDPPIWTPGDCAERFSS